jgi:hypothetical protein
VEDVGICYGHLVHFTVFCNILWTFGILFKEKSGNPAGGCNAKWMLRQFVYQQFVHLPTHVDV